MKPTPHQVIRSNVNHSRKKKKRVINDESIMNISMASTANDLVHVTELLSSGTKEIQDVLKHECALIYECKVCRGLFRSIINFVIHKRKYCVTKFSAINQQDLSSKLQQVESLFRTTSSSQAKPMRTIQPPTLSSFYESLISKTLGSVSPDGKGVTNDILKMQSATVLLDKLDTTVTPQIPTDTPELTRLINDSSTAILQEDGTIATNVQTLGQLYKDGFASCSPAPVASAPQSNGRAKSCIPLHCSICKFKCQARPVLYKHLQENHFTFYKCEKCLKNYNSVRSVLRHLYEVHHIKRARVDQKFKKKIIMNKVVKSVPKHLYSIPASKPIDIITPPTTITHLSSCGKCSALFTSSSGAVHCPSCTQFSDSSSVKSDDTQSRRITEHPAPSPAKYLMKGCSNKVVRSPASSCAGDIPSPGSPAVRLSCEDTRGKAGIQVRMNYDKCTPGNPIVSKIETPDETTVHTTAPSPSCDSASSKENAQLNGDISNGEKENQIGTKEKRKNLDTITQKLLNNKIADDTCKEIKLSCSPLFHRNRETDRIRKSVRKMALDLFNGTPALPVAILDVPDSEVEEGPKRITRRTSVESRSVTRRSSTSQKRDTSTSSSKSLDSKAEAVKKTNAEPQSNGLDHSASTEQTEVNRKRKLRVRTETIVNKKNKSDEDLAAKVEVIPSDEQVPKPLRGSCESLEDWSGSSENERLLKSLMKDAMDLTSDTCRVCSISFPNKKLLRIHLASRHLGYFRFRCGLSSCGKMYFSHSDATQHARTSHSNQNEEVVRVDASGLSMASALEVQARLKETQTSS